MTYSINIQSSTNLLRLKTMKAWRPMGIPSRLTMSIAQFLHKYPKLACFFLKLCQFCHDFEITEIYVVFCFMKQGVEIGCTRWKWSKKEVTWPILNLCTFFYICCFVKLGINTSNCSAIKSLIFNEHSKYKFYLHLVSARSHDAMVNSSNCSNAKDVWDHK